MIDVAPDWLAGELADLRAQLAVAEAKADRFESDWVAAKYEFGVAINAARAACQEVLDAERAAHAETKAQRDAALRALRPFARFAEQWDRQPLSRIDDNFYSIHTGTEYEAELRLSDCRAARAILAATPAPGEEKKR